MYFVVLQTEVCWPINSHNSWLFPFSWLIYIVHDWGPLKQTCQETYVFFWWHPFTTSPASPASCPVTFAKGLALNDSFGPTNPRVEGQIYSKPLFEWQHQTCSSLNFSRKVHPLNTKISCCGIWSWSHIFLDSIHHFPHFLVAVFKALT